MPLWLLATVPAAWAFVDSLLLLELGSNSLVIPHFPPLYPLFAWAVNLGLAAAEEAPAITDRGLLAMVVLQQALAVVAVVAFARSASRALWRQLLVVALVALNPIYFLLAHSLRTEALWLPLVLLLLALALRIWEAAGPSPAAWLGYYSVLLLAVLTRHPSLLLAGLLPALYLFGFVFFGQRRRNLWRLVTHAAAGLLVLVAANLVTAAVCDRFDAKPRALWGRAAVYRIVWTDWDEIPRREKRQLIRQLRRAEPDPLVRRAIPVVLASTQAWGGAYGDVHRLLAESPLTPPGADLEVLADEVLNAVCWRFLTSRHPIVVDGIRRDFLEYVTANDPAHQGRQVLAASVYTYEQFPGNEHVMPRLGRVTTFTDGFDRGALLEAYAETQRHPYFRVFEWVEERHAALALAAASLLALALGWLPKERCAAILVFLGFIYVYYAAMSVASVYVARYAVFASVVLFAAASLFVSGVGSAAKPTAQTRRGSASALP